MYAVDFGLPTPFVLPGCKRNLAKHWQKCITDTLPKHRLRWLPIPATHCNATLYMWLSQFGGLVGTKTPHYVEALKDTLSERCSWGLPRMVSSEGRRWNSCCKIRNAFVAKACVQIWCNRRCAFRTTFSSRIIIESQAIYIYIYMYVYYIIYVYKSCMYSYSYIVNSVYDDDIIWASCGVWLFFFSSFVSPMAVLVCRTAFPPP